MFSFVTPGASHVLGLDPEGPLERLTIHGAFLRAETCCKAFVIAPHQGRTLTYDQVGAMAREFAANLDQKLGFKRGDRLGVWLPNRWEFVVTLVGCSMAGVVLTTINPAYRASELAHACKLVGLKGLLLQARLKGSNYHDILKEAGAIPSLDCVIECCEGAPQPGCVAFSDLLQTPKQPFVIPSDVSCDEAANIQFTSGTTGSPKGAVLSHYNIVNNAAQFGRRLLIREQDVVVIPLPLYHCFGLNLGVVTTITARATRGGAIGGSPCPPELMYKLVRDLGMAQIACAYGMTETSPVSLSTASILLFSLFVLFFFFRASRTLWSCAAEQWAA
jgi:fatty-acyl-CoA synthase